jgi:hypothetical protein
MSDYSKGEILGWFFMPPEFAGEFSDLVMALKAVCEVSGFEFFMSFRQRGRFLRI